MDCVDVCPMDCFYEGENMLVIHPDECIDYGVREPECPVDAIKPGTEPGLEKWLSLNAEYAKIWPNITVKKEIISERNGGAAQTRLGWLQRPRSVALPDLEAHPCPAPSACGPHCSTPRKKKEFVQVRLAKDQHPVQALATHGAN